MLNWLFTKVLCLLQSPKYLPHGISWWWKKLAEEINIQRSFKLICLVTVIQSWLDFTQEALVKARLWLNVSSKDEMMVNFGVRKLNCLSMILVFWPCKACLSAAQFNTIDCPMKYWAYEPISISTGRFTQSKATPSATVFERSNVMVLQWHLVQLVWTKKHTLYVKQNIQY